MTTSVERKHDYKGMTDAVNKDQLEVYLKDHYAGAVGALELIEHSIKTHEGTPLAAFFEKLHGDVKADHEQLHNLMTTLGFEDSGVRNAGAWMAEKLGRAKLGFSGGESSELRLLQTLESLFLGITGKQLLWRALQAMRGFIANLAAHGFRVSGEARHRTIGTGRSEAARSSERIVRDLTQRKPSLQFLGSTGGPPVGWKARPRSLRELRYGGGPPKRTS